MKIANVYIQVSWYVTVYPPQLERNFLCGKYYMKVNIFSIFILTQELMRQLTGPYDLEFCVQG